MASKPDSITENKESVFFNDSHNDVFLKDCFGRITFSFGYKINESVWEEDDNGNLTRTIKDADLVGIYLVDRETGKDLGELKVDQLQLPDSIVNLHKEEKQEDFSKKCFGVCPNFCDCSPNK